MKVFISVHVCVCAHARVHALCGRVHARACACNEIQVIYLISCLVEINVDLSDENYI